MSEFEVNILPFNILQEQINIFFSQEEKLGYFRIYKNNLPKNFPSDIKDQLDKFAWWSTIEQNGDLPVSVNLIENKRFSKHYFNKILFDYFYEQNILTNRNFINDTEVYLSDISFPANEYQKYNGFSIRVDDNDLIRGPSLLVSYVGASFILNKSVETLNLNNSFLRGVKYQGRITKFKFLTQEEQSDKGNIYPILNREIRQSLDIKFDRNYSENKYKNYYEMIVKFYETHLKNVEINNCIKIFGSGFYKPHQSKINRATEESNLLLFGRNNKHFTPYIGIKEYGPLQPPPEKNIKFIFIFHEEDKEFANKVYSYLKRGFKSFPGLESFVKIKFEIDTDNSIRFTQHNPIQEIKASLENIHFEHNAIYAALYISRIGKDTDDEDDEIYYKIKEILLQRQITSQVILKEKINNPSFNYFLPNIAIALLAKLGGIPWRLYRPIRNDLIIGVGADRSQTVKERYIGNAFCFQNDGNFKGFNAFEKSDTLALANSIRDAIEQYINENKGPERLVIHYYKKMSRKEEQPISDVLRRLNLSLPYVIVTINDSEDYVLFDYPFDGKMPQSGTFLQIKENEFLLCNNTRYSRNTGTRIEGFPLPIKIKLRASNDEKITNINVVTELIDQVYQFSRMYWKSVRQRNMPVTIEYSEMVAKMIAHFDNKDLPSFARNSLWFL
ncbi:MAG: Piwi domain-containing protein [Anaerolineales bacterium]